MTALTPRSQLDRQSALCLVTFGKGFSLFRLQLLPTLCAARPPHMPLQVWPDAANLLPGGLPVLS